MFLNTMKHFPFIYQSSPTGSICIEGSRVEEVERGASGDSAEDSDSDDTALPDYTLLLWPPEQPPTYLMIATKHEKVYTLTL